MVEAELQPRDMLLLTMHNLGVVRKKGCKTIVELAQLAAISFDQLVEILKGLEEAGYVESLSDQKGIRCYFLTGRGIIRVSSLFT